MAGPPRHPLTAWEYLIHTSAYLVTMDGHEIECNLRNQKFEPSAIMRVIQLLAFRRPYWLTRLSTSHNSNSLLAVTADLHLAHAPDTVSK
jgi:hypothetical protein